ncbi:MAG: biotin--[acetyl-CoA-carboxylase] ligase [Oscillospiraceae bacterium]|nr:biotin--[acetyl-CoA-carboxylase] ligase [Oscillospiraceae bacterium]
MPNIIKLDEVDSTNSYMKAHLSKLCDGDVVTARLQTAGRGRLGHEWAADEGMLPLSILLKNPPERENITARVGLAVCEALKELGEISAFIKWPNDIIIGSRKVCGILCESAAFGDNFCVIVGIGVNVSQTAEFFENAKLPNAASLLMLTGKAPERETLTEKIAERVKLRAAASFAECYDEYKPRVINLGRQVRIISTKGEKLAEAVDISESGFLVCRDESGTFEVSSGEVSIRGANGYF